MPAMCFEYIVTYHTSYIKIILAPIIEMMSQVIHKNQQSPNQPISQPQKVLIAQTLKALLLPSFRIYARIKLSNGCTLVSVPVGGIFSQFNLVTKNHKMLQKQRRHQHSHKTTHSAPLSSSS